MDGWFEHPTTKKQMTVAFLSHHQANYYGGFALATRALGVDFIQPPLMIDTYHPDIAEHTEVGHA